MTDKGSYLLRIMLFGSLLALMLAVVTVGAFGRHMIFQVEAFEEGFVLRGDEVVRRHGPGMHFKIPLLERTAIIASLYVRQQSERVEGYLSNGGQCTVDADIQYRIAYAERALKWRLENGLNVTRENSIPEQRSDYVEPARVFTESLLQIMSEMTPGDAKKGAIEDWISDFSRSGDKSAFVDGTRIVHIKATDITCSDKTPAPVCNTIYEETARPFADPARLVFGREKGASFVVTLEEMSVVLKGQIRVLVGGLSYGFAIVDPDVFYSAVRSVDFAIPRIEGELDDGLRQSLGMVDLQGIDDFSLSQSVPEKIRKNFDRTGVELVYIDTAKAYYRVGETICQD